MRPMRRIAAFTIALCLEALPLAAQAPSEPTEQQGDHQQGEAPDADTAPAEDDESIDPAEPDFTVVNLPTGLAVPRMKSAFRVTHRFGRPLGLGDFGDLLENFFGLDGGAQIGLEYRFGIAPATQLGVYRTSERTIQFFGQYRLRAHSEEAPLGVALLAAVEGTNNFRDEYSPSLGAVVAYRFGSRGIVYAEPLWVGNTNHDPLDIDGDDGTLLVGLAGRVAVRETVFLVVEVAPRVAGHSPGDEHASFGIEKVVGGHVFQLNISNGIGSTPGQIARGGLDDWFIGFNISRKLW
jgi:hypothetical protein